MTPLDLFRNGDLSQALAVQQQLVADQPADPARRLFLFELLAFAGDLGRARAELDAIDSPDPAWPASADGFRQLLDAEAHRRRLFAGDDPVFFAGPADHLKHRRKAVRLLREGNWDGAVAALDRADESAPFASGHLDGREFDGLRDADDLLGPVLEVFANGEYGWVGFDQLRRIVFEPGRYLLDRLYVPARLRLADGAEAAVHVPALYLGTHEAGDGFRTGLETDWTADDAGLTRGLGQRVFLVGNDDIPIWECRQFDLRNVSG